MFNLDETAIMNTEIDNRLLALSETQATEPQRSPTSSSESAEKLDKVRDILFGNEFRLINQRLAGLDQALASVSTQLRTEFRQHINSVEHALKTLSDDVSATVRELNRDKADKLALAEMLEALASKLRQDHEEMSH